MDVATSGFGGGGGPFTSTTRIMNSELKNKYRFKKLYYRKELGKGISIKRIVDLYNQLKYIQPDIVHFTGLQLSGFHVVIACRLAGIKNTVVTIRGFSSDALFFNWFKKFIVSFILEPLTLMLSKKVTCVSDYVISRKVVKLLCRKKSIRIYNYPPDINEINKNPLNIREELGLNNSDIIFVSVARITKDKGYHLLDDVILNFKNDNNFKFIIIGDGDYLPIMKSKLKNQIENKQVFLLGFRKDVNQILQNCNVFILPTLHETLSVALLEASQAGLALLASKTGGIPEIIENGFNGYLFETSNNLEMIEKINYLGNNKYIIKNMGLNAKNKVKNKFNPKIITNQLEMLYSNLLKNEQ